ncbi:MAG: hypothetical protein OXH29_12220 [bacterium]|nr:hypothetical protein [Acidimicrobiaceae bacterium]MCY3633428.1 hypothetical protein [bacterium]
MVLADPETALARVREFRDLLNADKKEVLEGGQTVWERLSGMRHLVEAIAGAIDPDNVKRLSTEDRYGGWITGDAYGEALRLIGILERQADYQQIFGPEGPTLAADRLHSWVWSAAANLWDDGHHIAAVDAAFKKVELQTQQKLRASKRRSGADLYAQAFSLDDPKPDTPRLRIPHIDRAEAQETWNSAHEGAMHVGMGCAKGIRNPLAHPSEDTSETGEDEKQEALEQLAALSVLARWVDECDVDRADGDAAGQ